jgi:hypothetical protein
MPNTRQYRQFGLAAIEIAQVSGAHVHVPQTMSHYCVGVLVFTSALELNVCPLHPRRFLTQVLVCVRVCWGGGGP